MLKSPTACTVGGCVRLCPDLVLGQYFHLDKELLDLNEANEM